MKASFLLIPVLVVISGCAGPERIKAGEDKHLTYYFNDSYRTNESDNVIIWDLADFKTKQKELGYGVKIADGFKSVTAQYEYNCADRFLRLKWVKAYSGNMGKGELVEEGTVPGLHNKWISVPPGGPRDAALISVCNAKLRSDTERFAKARSDAKARSVAYANNDAMMNILLWSLLLDGHHH